MQGGTCKCKSGYKGKNCERKGRKRHVAYVQLIQKVIQIRVGLNTGRSSVFGLVGKVRSSVLGSAELFERLTFARILSLVLRASMYA